MKFFNPQNFDVTKCRFEPNKIDVSLIFKDDDYTGSSVLNFNISKDSKILQKSPLKGKKYVFFENFPAILRE